VKSAFPKPSGLALSGHEPTAHIDDEVVSLIDTKRYENPVSALDQLGLDRSLAAMAHVDGVIGQRRLPERHQQQFRNCRGC